MHVSAWVPRSDTLTPDQTIAELRTARISRAILMVNDHSDDTGPTRFTTFDRTALATMAAKCRAAGIDVWLCSWVMPHAVFIDGMVAELPSLIAECQSGALMLDAEEPWTEATGTFDRARAAQRLATCFGKSLALTAIGSAPRSVSVLAAVCPIWAFQGYATLTTIAKGQATPGGVIPYSLKLWRENYGQPTRWLAGLAGYDQAPRPSETMQPPLDDVVAAGITEVAYWSSNSISKRADVQSFVANLSPAPAQTHPGIMPTIDVAALPSATRVQAVAEIQGLLVAWGVDPGPVDGKPGTKTLAAVQAFQRARGLTSSGIVDAATWSELLRP